jgi:uncharacterized protein
MRAVLALAVVVAGVTRASANTPLPARGDHSVFDAANAIDDTREQALEAINRELFDRAKVAVVVITVPRLVDETISELAVRVQHDWGVGQRGKDESVVIALSVEDRKIFLATGYGSEGYLPDGKVGEIRDLATPFLRSNDFSTGLYTADLAIAQVAAAAHGVTLTGAAAQPLPRARGGDDSGVLSLVFFGIIIVVAGALASRGRGGRGGGGGGFGGFWLGALLGSLFGNRGRGGWGDGGGGWGGGGGAGGGDAGGGGFGGFGGGSGGGGGAGGNF